MPNEPIPIPTLKRKYYVIMIGLLAVLVAFNFISQVRQETVIIYLEHDNKMAQKAVNETKAVQNQSKANFAKLENIANETEKLNQLHYELMKQVNKSSTEIEKLLLQQQDNKTLSY